MGLLSWKKSFGCFVLVASLWGLSPSLANDVSEETPALALEESSDGLRRLLEKAPLAGMNSVWDALQKEFAAEPASLSGASQQCGSDSKCWNARFQMYRRDARGAFEKAYQDKNLLISSKIRAQYQGTCNHEFKTALGYEMCLAENFFHDPSVGPYAKQMLLSALVKWSNGLRVAQASQGKIAGGKDLSDALFRPAQLQGPRPPAEPSKSKSVAAQAVKPAYPGMAPLDYPDSEHFRSTDPIHCWREENRRNPSLEKVVKSCLVADCRRPGDVLAHSCHVLDYLGLTGFGNNKGLLESMGYLDAEASVFLARAKTIEKLTQSFCRVMGRDIAAEELAQSCPNSKDLVEGILGSRNGSNRCTNREVDKFSGNRLAQGILAEAWDLVNRFDTLTPAQIHEERGSGKGAQSPVAHSSCKGLTRAGAHIGMTPEEMTAFNECRTEFKVLTVRLYGTPEILPEQDRNFGVKEEHLEELLSYARSIVKLYGKSDPNDSGSQEALRGNLINHDGKRVVDAIQSACAMDWRGLLKLPMADAAFKEIAAMQQPKTCPDTPKDAKGRCIYPWYAQCLKDAIASSESVSSNFTEICGALSMGMLELPPLAIGTGAVCFAGSLALQGNDLIGLLKQKEFQFSCLGSAEDCGTKDLQDLQMKVQDKMNSVLATAALDGTLAVSGLKQLKEVFKTPLRMSPAELRKYYQSLTNLDEAMLKAGRVTNHAERKAALASIEIEASQVIKTSKAESAVPQGYVSLYERKGEAVWCLKPLSARALDEAAVANRMALERLGIKPESLKREMGILDSQFLTGPDKWYWRGRTHQYEITKDVLPQAGKASVDTLILKHPDLPRYIDELHQLGYKLVVDSSSGLPAINGGSLGGYHNAGLKVISIDPSQAWNIFLHEFEHLKFDQKILKEVNFSGLQAALKIPVTRELLKGLAKDNPMLAKTIALAKKGLSQTAVNETLAVEAELKALKAEGYHSLSKAYLERRDNALWHQVQELSPPILAVEKRTLQQTMTLKLAMAERLLFTQGQAPLAWEAASVSGRTMAITMAILTPPAAVTTWGMIHVSYNEKTHKLLIRHSDGTYSEISLEDIASRLSNDSANQYVKFIEPTHPMTAK
ncbi:hypothetical protein WDW37_01800 [Bdellovibrionota bacterium FG-1]